jgi:hypothetical protein
MISLQLREESWGNLLYCLRKKDTVIDSEGNFWSAVQELERQFLVDTKEIEYPNQLKLFGGDGGEEKTEVSKNG